MTSIKIEQGRFVAMFFMLTAIFQQVSGDEFWAEINFIFASLISIMVMYFYVKLLKGE